MKFYVSYFYQIRFFTPKDIPISTAIWDPKWFHQNRGNKYCFYDANGVLNGLRAPQLMLPEEWAKEIPVEKMCTKSCPHEPFKCEFMKVYSKYLDTLDFDKFHAAAAQYVQDYAAARNMNPDELNFVLIVYESPSRNCAERPCLRKWFEDHNEKLPEWSPSVANQKIISF